MKTFPVFLSATMLAFPVLSLLLITGCGKSLQKQITGKWGIDKQNELFEMMGDDEAASDENRKFVLEFSAAGVFQSKVNSSGHSQTKQGRWFFIAAEGDTCKLKVSINSDKPDICLLYTSDAADE